MTEYNRNGVAEFKAARVIEGRTVIDSTPEQAFDYLLDRAKNPNVQIKGGVVIRHPDTSAIDIVNFGRNAFAPDKFQLTVDRIEFADVETAADAYIPFQEDVGLNLVETASESGDMVEVAILNGFSDYAVEIARLVSDQPDGVEYVDQLDETVTSFVIPGA